MEMRWRLALCLGLVFFCAAMPLSVQATEETRRQIEEAEQQKEETESRLDETEENLKGLNEQHSSLQGTLSTLNTELTQVSSKGRLPKRRRKSRTLRNRSPRWRRSLRRRSP